MSSRAERVFLDTDEARAVPLECIDVADRRWNGALIPRVFSWQVSAFVKRWRQADPNGTWGDVFERVDDGALVVTRNDSADPDDWDTWLPTDRNEHGVAIYELEGWMWTR